MSGMKRTAIISFQGPDFLWRPGAAELLGTWVSCTGKGWMPIGNDSFVRGEQDGPRCWASSPIGVREAKYRPRDQRGSLVALIAPSCSPPPVSPLPACRGSSYHGAWGTIQKGRKTSIAVKLGECLWLDYLFCSFEYLLMCGESSRRQLQIPAEGKSSSSLRCCFPCVRHGSKCLIYNNSIKAQTTASGRWLVSPLVWGWMTSPPNSCPHWTSECELIWK